jgi:hypothetical protein
MQVQDFDGYREFVIATLPQLKRLDGKEVRAHAFSITPPHLLGPFVSSSHSMRHSSVRARVQVTPSERIQAKQNYPEIRRRLEAELEAEGVDLEAARRIEVGGGVVHARCPALNLRQATRVCQPSWCSCWGLVDRNGVEMRGDHNGVV